MSYESTAQYILLLQRNVNNIVSFLFPLPNILPQKIKKIVDEKYSPLATLTMKQQ